MNKLKTMIVSALLVVSSLGVASLAFAPSYADPIDPQTEACSGTGGSGGAGACTGNSTQADLPKVIKTGVNILLYIIGIIAVIAIIIGALRYVTSAGDSSKVKAAKDSILYAVVGLVIAILAYAIVNFVVTAFK